MYERGVLQEERLVRRRQPQRDGARSAVLLEGAQPRAVEQQADQVGAQLVRRLNGRGRGDHEAQQLEQGQEERVGRARRTLTRLLGGATRRGSSCRCTRHADADSSSASTRTGRGSGGPDGAGGAFGTFGAAPLGVDGIRERVHHQIRGVVAQQEVRTVAPERAGGEQTPQCGDLRGPPRDRRRGCGGLAIDVGAAREGCEGTQRAV